MLLFPFSLSSNTAFNGVNPFASLTRGTEYAEKPLAAKRVAQAPPHECGGPNVLTLGDMENLMKKISELVFYHLGLHIGANDPHVTALSLNSLLASVYSVPRTSAASGW